MESITSFISELASYYWHENDLSNITVALCNSNVTFKTLFVKFFFPDIEVSEIDEIRREVPDEGNHGRHCGGASEWGTARTNLTKRRGKLNEKQRKILN